MGRKKLTCNIGDIYGCFEVLTESFIKGEHSFVEVKCINCGTKQTLAVSEIKNRPKQSCYNCRGNIHKKYEDPKVGDIFHNWEVIENLGKNNGFLWFLCKCNKCGDFSKIRKDQLLCRPKQCPKCKTKVKNVKSKKTSIKRNQPFLTKFNLICSEAAKRSILVTITPEYLEKLYNSQNKCCALSGDFLPDVRKASLDRIDSNRPYEEGNVQWVTKEVNLAKHVLTVDQFIAMCTKVVNHANQQPSQGLTTLEGSETNGWNCNAEYNTDTSAEPLTSKVEGEDIVRHFNEN